MFIKINGFYYTYHVDRLARTIFEILEHTFENYQISYNQLNEFVRCIIETPYRIANLSEFNLIEGFLIFEFEPNEIQHKKEILQFHGMDIDILETLNENQQYFSYLDNFSSIKRYIQEQQMTTNISRSSYANFNQERNGIEVYFSDAPSVQTRNKLLQSGFRWSRRKSHWWAEYTPDRYDFVTELMFMM